MAINVVEKIDDAVKLQHVLLSVSDKSGLEILVPGLLAINPEIMLYSTGGTFAKVKDLLGTDWQKNLMQVSAYTGQPEMQGGLVKTLDFKIYLGLLSETYNEAHVKDMARVKGVNFDMVVCNLYPFSETIARADATPESARGNIDIGGPCMVRASAKNFLRVASVTDPGDYTIILNELKQTSGCLSLQLRWELAKKAFQHTAEYDTKIAGYFKSLDFAQVKNCYKQGK